MRMTSSVAAAALAVALSSSANAGMRYRSSPPLTISGTPATSVAAGSSYASQPYATDRERDRLRFYITNKPVWAVFRSSAGILSGTPTTAQVATYANIQISVSVGKTSTFLPAFSMAVTGSEAATTSPTNHEPALSGLPPSSGTAMLSWTAPTLNTDGTPLTDLGGYRVYHGVDPALLTDVRTLVGTATTGYQFNSLPSGTHYFAVTAYNLNGIESVLSSVGPKTIP